jgi:hypothetical protein
LFLKDGDSNENRERKNAITKRLIAIAYEQRLDP